MRFGAMVLAVTSGVLLAVLIVALIAGVYLHLRKNDQERQATKSAAEKRDHELDLEFAKRCDTMIDYVREVPEKKQSEELKELWRVCVEKYPALSGVSTH